MTGSRRVEASVPAFSQQCRKAAIGVAKLTSCCKLVVLQTSASELPVIDPVADLHSSRPCSIRPGGLTIGRIHVHTSCTLTSRAQTRLHSRTTPRAHDNRSPRGTSSTPGDTTLHVPNNSPDTCSASKQWLSHPVRLCSQPTNQPRVPSGRCWDLRFDSHLVVA